MNRIELCPGVWLNMICSERFKTGCVSINILRPLAEETAALHALLPSVLLRGCKTYPNMQMISHRLDELYGASVGTLVRKRGEVHSFGLYADFLEDCYVENEPVFAQMMQLLRQLVFEPCLEDGGFLSEYVTGEKQNLSNTIASRINDKRAYAITRLLKDMCDVEAYRVTRLGEAEVLQGVDGKQLYDFWQQILASSPIELFYLGQQSEESVVAQMKAFADLLPKRGALIGIGTEIMLPERPVRFVEEALDVTQGKLAIGFRTPITVLDQRMPALLLLNSVYGAGMTSKLFMKIREEQSLCYYASSSLDKHKGIMVVSSGIDFDKYEVARDGILHQLELCKQGDITEEELELARNYLISALRTTKDSPGQMDDFVLGQVVGGTMELVDDLIARLKAVTLQQVVEAAQTLRTDTIYFLKGVLA